MDLGLNRYSDSHGSRERKVREYKHHPARKDGDIMVVAEGNIISTHPANSIKNVAELMLEHDFRRIPVTDAGSGRLEGVAKSIDIIDFLGGGEKYNIIEKDFDRNFLAAINCPISKIMSQAVYLNRKSSIDDAVKVMLEKGTSLIPIVDDDEHLKVIAILSERDVLPTTEEFGVKVSEVMKKEVVSASPGMMLSDVAKIMVRNKLRRLPVISEEEIIGIVTQFDLLRVLTKGEFKGVFAEETLSVRVSDIMEKEVISVRPEQDLAEIVAMVKETGLGGFPVMEDGKPLGIVTTMDVIRHIYTS